MKPAVCIFNRQALAVSPTVVHIHTSPNKRWVDLSVNKQDHLKSHGDTESTDTGHHCLQPQPT